MADTREQKVLDFSSIVGVEKVEEVALSYGDYSAIIHGSSVPIVFERKNLSDLFGTMTSGYERYKKEMERAKADGIKLILIIEGSYTDVYAGIAHSQFSGESMVKKLAMLYVRYDHEYIFCESRRVMARRITDTYLAMERNWAKENSSKSQPTGVSEFKPSNPVSESTVSFGLHSLPEGD